jgi:hypothetical protein
MPLISLKLMCPGSPCLFTGPVPVGPVRYNVPGTGKKTPGGAGTNTGHTGHADAQRHTDHTDEPHRVLYRYPVP